MAALKRQTRNGHEVPAGGSLRGNEKTSVLPAIGNIAFASRVRLFPSVSTEFRPTEFISELPAFRFPCYSFFLIFLFYFLVFEIA